METVEIIQVRRFNRIVTKRVGALEDSYLSRGRPLSEARLIYEVGTEGGVADVRLLRGRLGLDSGYMSRLLRSLEQQGMITLRSKAEDARARQVALTAKGIEEFAAYDALSNGLAASILSPLVEADRERLVAAMAEVERLFRKSAVEIVIERADSTEARRCLAAYYAELAQRFDGGFDPALGSSVDPSEMTPPTGWFVTARLEGLAVGCGALKRLSDDVGEIKRVWTAGHIRGIGVASRIMDKLEELARQAGFAKLRLDTNKALNEAHSLYLRRGYHEIARYNDNPYADHWFEKLI